jgi:hypothetical protein
MSAHASATGSLPSVVLEELAHDAIGCVKKARKHHCNLTGDNFYANKLATLRADATNVYRALSAGSAGEASAIAELIEGVFSAQTARPVRVKAYRELCFNLRTTWQSVTRGPSEEEGMFPMSILAQAKRGYLVTIGRQMNGCYARGWYDAAAVMMRRLIEITIIEAFEGKGLAAEIKTRDGDYFQLSGLIERALIEQNWTLSRNARRVLPSLRDVGHRSAHGRYFTAKKEDLDGLQSGCRAVVEEFLHHAGLLQ